MIDVESRVFTDLKAYVIAKLPALALTDDSFDSSYTATQSVFPHIYIEQYDSHSEAAYETNADKEKYRAIAFQIDVYSNITTGRKEQCKKIIRVIDDWFYSRNFRCTMQSPMPNLNDATIYRITARYEGMTDGSQFYRKR